MTHAIYYKNNDEPYKRDKEMAKLLSLNFLFLIIPIILFIVYRNTTDLKYIGILFVLLLIFSLGVYGVCFTVNFNSSSTIFYINLLAVACSIVLYLFLKKSNVSKMEMYVFLFLFIGFFFLSLHLYSLFWRYYFRLGALRKYTGQMYFYPSVLVDKAITQSELFDYYLFNKREELEKKMIKGNHKISKLIS